MTRRELLSLAGGGLPAGPLLRAQMTSRGVQALSRGKASGLPFNSHLVNVAHAAGLRAPVVYGGIERNDYILESMGCGAAFIDYDNDGWLDIVMLTGRRLEATPAGAVIRLYKNNRNGTFSDVTERSGLGRSVWACGITAGDYDNDGFDDLFITCWGHNLLFHNNGDGTFTDVTERAGLLEAGTHYGSGATWIDYDRDGRLDLFAGHYAVFDFGMIPPAGQDPACNWRAFPWDVVRAGWARRPIGCTTITAMERSAMSVPTPVWRCSGRDTRSPRPPWIWITMAGRTFT